MKKFLKSVKVTNLFCLVGVLTVAVAESSMSTCCFFIFNQPKVPDKLKRLT